VADKRAVVIDFMVSSIEVVVNWRNCQSFQGSQAVGLNYLRTSCTPGLPSSLRGKCW